MSLRKKDIVKNLSSEAFFDNTTSKSFLESFLNIIKENKEKTIKVSNFGTFYMHCSPERIGRNPITKKEYLISSRKKLTFKASSLLKSSIN